MISLLCVLALLIGVTYVNPNYRGDGSNSTTYVDHSKDVRYCIAEDGVDVTFRMQDGGTCWLYSSVACMETSYRKKLGKDIDLNPMDFLNYIYAPVGEKEEGLFITDYVGANKERGGEPLMCAETYADGFTYDKGQFYVVDSVTVLDGNDFEQLKEYLSRVGAISVGVPDTDDSKKSWKGGFRTLNHVTDREEDYDHSVTLIGWDDAFPKDLYAGGASRDGAWIAYNSNYESGYYYISYDTVLRTPLGFSLTDEYSKVLSYDCGNDLGLMPVYDVSEELPDDNRYEDGWCIGKGSTVKTANVFDAGDAAATGERLTAVGTYSRVESQDIVIEIYDRDLKKVKYTQNAHLDHMGYHVIELDKQLKIKDGFAIAITYESGATVEGEETELFNNVLYKPVSEPGKSFVYSDGEWVDLHSDGIKERLGIVFEPNNACIKALFAPKN